MLGRNAEINICIPCKNLFVGQYEYYLFEPMAGRNLNHELLWICARKCHQNSLIDDISTPCVGDLKSHPKNLLVQGCLFYACLSHRMFLVRKIFNGRAVHIHNLYQSFICLSKTECFVVTSNGTTKSTHPIALGRCQRTFPNGPQQVRWGGLSQLVNLLPEKNYQQTLGGCFDFWQISPEKWWCFKML